MFDKMKGKPGEFEREPAPAPQVRQPAGAPSASASPAAAPPATAPSAAAASTTAASTAAAPKAAAVSQDATSISPGMTIVGKLSGDGTVKVFGRVEGELHAPTVLICQGAHVEGNIVAQELTVGGRVKGTMHAARVKLQGTADVEGDIFHRSLSIEENARFEGTSRREDNAANTSASAAKAVNAQAQVQAQAPATTAPQPKVVPIDANQKFKSPADHEEIFRSAE